MVPCSSLQIPPSFHIFYTPVLSHRMRSNCTLPSPFINIIVLDCVVDHEPACYFSTRPRYLCRNPIKFTDSLPSGSCFSAEPHFMSTHGHTLLNVWIFGSTRLQLVFTLNFPCSNPYFSQNPNNFGCKF